MPGYTGGMAREHLQPEGVFESGAFGFSQVVTTGPGKLVFVSGQVGWDADMKLVGGTDLRGQAEQALANLGRCLAAAGAAPADVTMMRVYVVGYRPEHGAVLGPLIRDFHAGGRPPASTWIGVAALASPELLVEIEAVAVVGG